MIQADVYTRAGVEAGQPLPAYAWPGGYPIIYLTPGNDVVCPDCANGENDAEFNNPDPDYAGDQQWEISALEVYYEGPPEMCCHCYKEIASAYGDPNALDEPVHP